MHLQGYLPRAVPSHAANVHPDTPIVEEAVRLHHLQLPPHRILWTLMNGAGLLLWHQSAMHRFIVWGQGRWCFCLWHRSNDSDFMRVLTSPQGRCRRSPVLTCWMLRWWQWRPHSRDMSCAKLQCDTKLLSGLGADSDFFVVPPVVIFPRCTYICSWLGRYCWWLNPGCASQRKRWKEQPRAAGFKLGRRVRSGDSAFPTSIRSGEQTALPVPTGWGEIASLACADIFFWNPLGLLFSPNGICQRVPNYVVLKFKSNIPVWGREGVVFTLQSGSSLLPFPPIPTCYGAARGIVWEWNVTVWNWWVTLCEGGGENMKSCGVAERLLVRTDSLMMELRGFE